MDEDGNPIERPPKGEGESSYDDEEYDSEEGEEGEGGDEEDYDDEDGSDDQDGANLGKRGASGNGHNESASKRQK